MNKNKIPRRSLSEANYLNNKHKPQFKTKEKLSILEQNLKISGLMLYWAEGTFHGNTVDFANSNPEMIKVFLRFLREICGVQEERLRIYLYAYSYQNIDQLKIYWHKITQIPLNQFTKPYIRIGNLNLSKRKLLYGLVHIRYNDKRLLGLIKSWTDKFIKDWAGTQAAKGGRLYKMQHLTERLDEKVGEFRETLKS
ncbi:MAG: hypothetical protein Q8L26_06470 [Candidatus Omnitrophota bacterium]|nr:hypothetical protein [Candidatus Omnitrophota bacterium]